MKIYELYPEVAGSIDESVIVNVASRPITISSMHYELDGWLGDDLLTEAGYFLVTESLATGLVNTELSGFTVKDAIVTKSERFEEMYPDRTLPEFKWLIIEGQSNVDDFWFSKAAMKLNVTERGLSFLKKYQIANCDIEEI
jgi:hypothetical protein